MSNDGGPAFPVSGLQHDEGFNGMTLRDYFACHLLSGALAAGGGVDLHGENGIGSNIVGTCYMLADTMIKHRAKDTK